MKKILFFRDEKYLDGQIGHPINYEKIIEGWKGVRVSKIVWGLGVATQ